MGMFYSAKVSGRGVIFMLVGLVGSSAAWCPQAQAAIPVAVDDVYSTTANIALTVPTPGILANDTDADGDTLTAKIRTSVTNGTLNLKTDGRFVYIPNTGFTGSDSFTYWANDPSSAHSWATVTITVSNTAPTAVNDSYNATQNTALNIAAPGVLANDSDANGDPLSATVQTLPTKGTVSLASNGGFLYTPSSGYTGSDSFSYAVTDGQGGSASTLVTITIAASNNAPVAGADSYTATQDTTLNIAAPGVLANDTDANGDPLTVAVAGTPANGTLSLASSGGFTYTPTSGYSGPDSFTYTVSDGRGGSATGNVTLTVNALNLAPLAVNDTYSTLPDTALTVAIPGVLGNDSDPNGDALTAGRRTSPTNGTLTLKSNGRLVYIPNAGFTGTDSFTYWANDGRGKRSWATVTINVVEANNLPVATDDSYQSPQDTALTITPPGVLVNDSDSDGDPLTASVASAPANGTLSLATDGSFVYTPATGFSGADSFTYSVADGRGGSATATVSLNITPVLTDNAPNFIVVVADDMRYDDTAYMPNLQALIAANGVTFTNAHTNVSLCCPARSSILRGQYIHNHGVLDNDRLGGPEGGFHAFHDLGLENSTIATWMQATGYHTALIGKYLNEYGTDNSELFIPPGWDEWYAQVNNQNYYNYQLNQNGTLVSYGSAETDYATDVFAGLALDFVQRAADTGQPFFLYLAPTAPHKPYMAAPRHTNAFPEITQAPRPPSFNESDVSDKPLYVQAMPIMTATALSILDSNYRIRLQMLLAIDEMIGNLIATLESKGELDHTYIIFTSDNGVTLGEHRLNDLKSSPYEESIHVPLIVRVPGMENAPVARNEMIILPDVAPTVAALADATADSFVDGSSFAGLLNSAPATDWRQRFLVEYQGGPTAVTYYYALRSNQHLYVEYTTGETELYDIQNDPYQLCNLTMIDPLNPPADCFAGAQSPSLELSQQLATQLQALETCAAAGCSAAEQ